MPRLCALLTALLLFPAAAQAQPLIARSQALVDTSLVPVVRALYATADSVGLTIVPDSSREGQLLGIADGVRVRMRFERLSATQTFVHTQSDFGRQTPADRAREEMHRKWLNTALANIRTRRPGGVPFRYVAVIALDPQQPVCTAPDLPEEAAIVQPTPKRQAQPIYPDLARERGLGGYVLMSVTVSAEGRVTCAGAISAVNYGFTDAALSAVRLWTFTPGTVNGVPTDMVMMLPMRFRQRR